MANETSPHELTPTTDVYKTNRAQIEHYDNAINQRVIGSPLANHSFLMYTRCW